MKKYKKNKICKNRDNVISRRDFLNGCALSIAAGSSLPPLEAMAQGLADSSALPVDYYPPSLQGMRGSHEGSFEVAHAMRDGTTWQSVPSGESE